MFKSYCVYKETDINMTENTTVPHTGVKQAEKVIKVCAGRPAL